MKLLSLFLSLLLTGCLTNPQQLPILTCAGECTYYGPPQRNPNVEMAEVLTGGVVKLGLGLVNGSVMKAAFDRNSNSTNTIERTTTTNNSTAVSDVSNSESASSSTYISDTSSVSDTSVSDVSSSVTSIGE